MKHPSLTVFVSAERDFLSTTIGQMSGDQLSRNWWVGLEFKNTTTNDDDDDDAKAGIINNWVWLDGSLVDTGIT